MLDDLLKMTAQDRAVSRSAHDVVGVGDGLHDKIAVAAEVFVAAEIEIPESKDMPKLMGQDVWRDVVGTENDGASENVGRDRAGGKAL